MSQNNFTELDAIKIPNPINILPKVILVFIAFLFLLLTITPWLQTSKGFGYVIAIDPNNRTQTIAAPVSGRIKKWYIQDGNHIKKGQKLVEIVDNDPKIIQRIMQELKAKERKLEVTKIAANTSKINYLRQEDLFKQGLSSRKSFENAKIKYKKLLSDEQTIQGELSEVQVKLARQQSQAVYAPQDGTVLKLRANNISTLVKAGDELATFAPDLNDPAVELYVNGNDIALVKKGRKVRLQFEGWPAVQFSGWPEIAIGTFGGVVSFIDSSASPNGKFRVIITRPKDQKWPDKRFLRHHAKVYGWILLNEVKLGYEIWRQINSFPPEFDEKVKKIEEK